MPVLYFAEILAQYVVGKRRIIFHFAWYAKKLGVKHQKRRMRDHEKKTFKQSASSNSYACNLRKHGLRLSYDSQRG